MGYPGVEDALICLIIVKLSLYVIVSCKFGKLLTPLQEEKKSFGSENDDEGKDTEGTGNLSAKITIDQEIPQFLPMLGQKVVVYFREI